MAAAPELAPVAGSSRPPSAAARGAPPIPPRRQVNHHLPLQLVADLVDREMRDAVLEPGPPAQRLELLGRGRRAGDVRERGADHAGRPRAFLGGGEFMRAPPAPAARAARGSR